MPDPDTIHRGLTQAEAVFTVLSSIGAVEAFKMFVGKVVEIRRARRQAICDAEAARLKGIEDETRAKIEAEQKLEAAEKEQARGIRKDAIEEVWKIAAERKQDVADLRESLSAVKVQNSNQQEQLNKLKDQHADCEERHAALEQKVESLTGTVTKIANGGMHQ